MLPRDTQYQDPWADINVDEEQAADPTQPAPLNPTVAAYLKAKQDAQAARDAGNQQGLNQDMAGAGVDIAGALFNHPSKQAVYFQHYNDTSAPKTTQAYKPHANGDDLRASADKSRAEGQANADRIGKDFDKKNAVDNQVRQQGREDVKDGQDATKFDQSNQEFAHKQSRQAGDDAFTDAQRTNAQAGFDDQAQARDPNSQKSQDFRKFVGTVAPDLANGLGKMSYEDASRSVPGMVNAYEARKGREANAKLAKDAKGDRDLDTDAGKMAEKLNPSHGRTGEDGKRQARIDSADRIVALVPADGNLAAYNKVAPSQVAELAKAVDTMISNGGGSVATFQHLVPKSAQGSMAEMINYITNHPGGANQGEFVKLLKETAERERDVTKGQLRASQVQAAGGFTRLKRERPDIYEQKLREAGIDPAEIDEQGRYAPKAKQGSKDAPAATPVVSGWDHFDAIQKGN